MYTYYIYIYMMKGGVSMGMGMGLCRGIKFGGWSARRWCILFSLCRSNQPTNPFIPPPLTKPNLNPNPPQHTR